MGETVRKTRSVCPKCLKNIPARLVREGEKTYMEKTCREHGDFRTVIWRGMTDFDEWRASARELLPGEGESCPGSCGICPEHGQGSCCVLLEVTRRCSLRCRFCFAGADEPEPAMAELKHAVNVIFENGRPLIQLSGGEPTMRDDLPELIRYIKSCGGRYVQLNSNGLRLAGDEKYVRELADAGLSFVFMQFDGVTDGVYEQLRGRALLDEKLRAIEMCAKYRIGVTLVPTVVRGVNDGQIGDIIRFAVKRSPAVRGVHFQPVSYFGRYPHSPENDERYTLDELVSAIVEQTDISEKNLAPSRCDHPACGLHASFVVDCDGTLYPTTQRKAAPCESSTAEQNRDYIGRRWTRAPEESECCCGSGSLEDMDFFLSRARSYCFTVTAMAFQDAWNLDIERLRRCSLHVYDGGALKPFCARYLTAEENAT